MGKWQTTNPVCGKDEYYCDFCGAMMPREELTETQGGDLICSLCEQKRAATTHGGPY